MFETWSNYVYVYIHNLYAFDLNMNYIKLGLILLFRKMSFHIILSHRLLLYRYFYIERIKYF